MNIRRRTREEEEALKGKRKLFDELAKGVDAMRQQREGKVTLRTRVVEKLPPLRSGTDTIGRVRVSTVKREEDDGGA